MTTVYDVFNLKLEEGDKDSSPKKKAKDASTTTKNEAQRQGRLYSKEYSQQPGGVRVEEMIYGVKMAHLSCTDDSEGRLKGSGANTLKALEEIVGTDNVMDPLSTLLKEHFDLSLDVWIDESGIRFGRAVDTQGLDHESIHDDIGMGA